MLGVFALQRAYLCLLLRKWKIWIHKIHLSTQGHLMWRVVVIPARSGNDFQLPSVARSLIILTICLPPPQTLEFAESVRVVLKVES